ncbi:hypothetical protein EVAR_43913_1 [Eumeta japonica]|uniref:Uncharacterized protein n=1 Tax=Eumeta variegata TaxID=151549 RepID=A0A4C1WQB9_EUMVA|nr:hypothetical protein EVAR_43913_1 [Eumeta japonica]
MARTDERVGFERKSSSLRRLTSHWQPSTGTWPPPDSKLPTRQAEMKGDPIEHAHTEPPVRISSNHQRAEFHPDRRRIHCYLSNLRRIRPFAVRH